VTGGTMRHVRDYTGWDPAFVPLALVWARCATHATEALAAWALFRGSRGTHVALWHSTGWRSEYVGEFAAPGTPERDEQLAKFAEHGLAFGPGNLPVARPDDGNPEGYSREVLECTRPSCNYRADLGRHGTRRIRDLLEALGAAHDYAIERDAAKTPAEVIEVNEFLRGSGDTPGCR
jgi:hypothetical protein